MIKIKITYLLTVFFSILILIIGHKIAVRDTFNLRNLTQEVVKAKVTRIIEQDIVEQSLIEEDVPITGSGERIFFEAKITDGRRKGETVFAIQSMNSFLHGSQKEVKSGSSILLINSNNEWYFNGYLRINGIIVLICVFVFCLLLFGRGKGFNTILSLTLTCGAIFAVFIPAILSGMNIYLMSIIVCVYTITMMILIILGYNKKALAAIIGCAGGVIVAGIIAIIMDSALHLTGIVDDQSRYLINLPGDLKLNLKAIIFAGIIIGAMGAIMDVAVSLASSLWEIKEQVKSISFKELFRSGVTIGRDIMGSMADTLILAYIGSSLTVVLILTIFSGSLLGLFNSEMIAVEILQALAGSIGILFAMPLTAFFSSIIYLRKKDDKSLPQTTQTNTN